MNVYTKILTIVLMGTALTITLSCKKNVEKKYSKSVIVAQLMVEYSTTKVNIRKAGDI